MWRVWIILGFLVTACAEFPDVDAALAADGPPSAYPDLLPFEDLLTAPEPRLADADADALIARASELRNRANDLRGPVIEPDARDRMDDGVAQP